MFNVFINSPKAKSKVAALGKHLKAIDKVSLRDLIYKGGRSIRSLSRVSRGIAYTASLPIGPNANLFLPGTTVWVNPGYYFTIHVNREC
jgi:hypothetical protein